MACVMCCSCMNTRGALTLEKPLSTAMQIEAAMEQAKAFCEPRVAPMQAVQPASWWGKME